MEYTYEGMVRYSFGFTNPNHAAALFAIVIPLFWGMRKIFTGRIAFACVFILEILLYLAIIATMSRTGIIAVILGGAFFFYLTHKHWGQKLDRKSLLRTGLIAAGAFVILLAFGILRRHYSWIGTPDDSMLNRLNLWQGGLQMLADNPSGVGTGFSGMIFTDFYQPMGSGLTFRTMVNSFLTFMVEHGILLSFIVAVPLIFSFAASFISLRSEMNDRRKYLIISLMASSFCAFISGMSSTCLDFSVISGCFSAGLPDLNSVPQLLLCVITSGIFVALVILSFRNLQLFHLKLSFLIALSASAALVSGVLMTGMLLNSSRKEICVVSTVNGIRWINVRSKAKPGDKMLILHDDRISSLRVTMNFFRMKHAGYSLEHPLSPVRDIESFFKNYDTVILCGKNAALADPGAKAKYVFYCPTSFIELEPGKTAKVYLNHFDEYGCNRQWENALAESKEKIKHL
ncbi:MAG: O-antigen ligase family protein [Victivallales bacterium]|jgi:hypothetical protein